MPNLCAGDRANTASNLSDTCSPRRSCATFGLPRKFHAAHAYAAAKPGTHCRELPLSDLYHNVAVTAIRDRFQPVEKKIFMGCASAGQRCCQSRLKSQPPRAGLPPKFYIDVDGVKSDSFAVLCVRAHPNVAFMLPSSCLSVFSVIFLDFVAWYLPK